MLADLINGHQPVAAVEREPYCCRILRDRRDEGWFPGLTVHECDLHDFDPSDYAGRVDCVSAGWPCQGISRAGNRQGLDDERTGLWSEVFRVIGIVRPRYAFFENGPDILALGAERVLCDLASLGMDAQWCRLSAGNTGASHERERWWCLAHCVPERLEGKLRGGGQRRGQLAEAVANAMPSGRDQYEPAQSIGRYWRDDDAGCLRDPPWRGDEAGWERAKRDGAPDPGVRRMVDASAWRLVKARVAVVGNGQDVLCAATAWALLGGPVT